MVLERSMTYKEKSVTENPENEKKFKSVLGDILVDRQGIEREEYKGEEHWEKIGAHMEEAELFKGFLPWDHIDKITKRDEHLKYPHVDIHLKKDEVEDEWEEKKLQIFFNKDSPDGYDEIDKFLRHIKLSWNAHLQSHSLKTLSYSYDDGEQVMQPAEVSDNEESSEEKVREVEEDEGEDEPEDDSAVEEEESGEEEEEGKKKKGKGEGYSNMVDNILEDIG